MDLIINDVNPSQIESRLLYDIRQNYEIAKQNGLRIIQPNRGERTPYLMVQGRRGQITDVNAIKQIIFNRPQRQPANFHPQRTPQRQPTNYRPQRPEYQQEFPHMTDPNSSRGKQIIGHMRGRGGRTRSDQSSQYSREDVLRRAKGLFKFYGESGEKNTNKPGVSDVYKPISLNEQSISQGYDPDNYFSYMDIQRD